MRAPLRLGTILLFFAGWATGAHAWQAVEQVRTYPVTGQSGAELYASIGRHGPKAGLLRAIALTTFKLTWTRDYQPQGNACTLVSARPKLIITTMVPEPSEALPAGLQAGWKRFSDGVRAHERVHAQIITDMVLRIEAETVGLSVPDDPKCSKIRSEMKTRLTALSLAQRQKSRDFDRTELGEGGAVHRLILDLVNGS